LGSLGTCLGSLSNVVKLDRSDVREQRSDQVRLVKKREVKTRDDVVNLAQDAQDAQACSGCSRSSGELTEPRVSRG
jgi:hypothetical protein